MKSDYYIKLQVLEEVLSELKILASEELWAEDYPFRGFGRSDAIEVVKYLITEHQHTKTHTVIA
jgi:hypothetical protein